MICAACSDHKGSVTDRAPLIELQDVRYRWPGRASFGLDIGAFSTGDARTTLLLGESGSGKSTFLSLICGTVTAQEGRVSVAGKDIARLSAGQRDRFRAEHIGLIFQQFNLLPYASVLDNILLALRFAPKRRARVNDPRQEAGKLCDDLGLPPDAIQVQAGTLSVGQQQRVAVARALIGAPKLIIADEPTSALDACTQAAFLDLLFSQAHAHDSTLLMVSHDARLATHFDRVIEMSEIGQTQQAAL